MPSMAFMKRDMRFADMYAFPVYPFSDYCASPTIIFRISHIVRMSAHMVCMDREHPYFHIPIFTNSSIPAHNSPPRRPPSSPAP